MQLGGAHKAVTEAAPGNIGVIDAEVPFGKVVGVVEIYCSVTPVNVTPFLSVTVAVSGWVKFWFTTTFVELPPVPLGTAKEMFAGGQVEKKPAELPAVDKLELIIVDPGACAVATPFWSIVRIDELCGV